jgi:hypothetical protein
MRMQAVVEQTKEDVIPLHEFSRGNPPSLQKLFGCSERDVLGSFLWYD